MDFNFVSVIRLFLDYNKSDLDYTPVLLLTYDHFYNGVSAAHFKHLIFLSLAVNYPLNKLLENVVIILKAFIISKMLINLTRIAFLLFGFFFLKKKLNSVFFFFWA